MQHLLQCIISSRLGVVKPTISTDYFVFSEGLRMAYRTPRVSAYIRALLRDWQGGQISLRAMGLVYTTLLSLAPLLALSFSLLKALGVHNRLEGVLLEFFRPLGEGRYQVVTLLVGFVEKVQVGVLGAVGVGILLYTVGSMMYKVESSFNALWQLKPERGWEIRLGQYLAVLLIGPTLGFIVVNGSNSLLKQLSDLDTWGFFTTILFYFSYFLPYFFLVMALSFFYYWVPSTLVQKRAATISAFIVGTIWHISGVIFTYFVGNAVDYNAIYSSFAILVFVLIWLYVNWLILLLGCRLTFYLQNPHILEEAEANLSIRAQEAGSLALMLALSEDFLHKKPVQTLDAWALRLAVSPKQLRLLLDPLLHQNWVCVLQYQLLLRIDPYQLTLREIWTASRGEPTPHAVPWLADLEQDAGHNLQVSLATAVQHPKP
jgi:membrane protein